MAKSLVVVSSTKAVCKDLGMRTSNGVFPVLNENLEKVVKKAVEKAKAEGRETVMDRDFAGLF